MDATRPWLCVCLFVAAAAGCSNSPDPALYGKFQAAQTAFDSSQTADDFRRTAAMYQEILDSGAVSGAVLYNQGNAFMRAGMKGRAVACYRQAQRYRPRDPYLDANLRSALGGRAGWPSKPVIEYILFWQDWLSYPGKFQLCTFTAGLVFGVAVIGLWWRKRLLKWLNAVFLALAIVFAISAIYDWYRFSYLRHGVVVVDEVLARKGNSESYEPAFNQPLKETTEFTVIEERGDWILVRMPGNQEGWIPRDSAVIF